MSLDGWSNIHNAPLVCCSVVTQSEQSVLVKTVDTSGNLHTVVYLKEIGVKSIKNVERSFGVHVRNFVTDNASNVSKMRKELENTDDVNIIQYGCSARLLNLLAKNIKIPGVKDKLLKVSNTFEINIVQLHGT